MKETVHLGNMLKELIRKKNIKRAEVASLAGVQYTAIYAYEKQSSLQTGNLLRLCRALQYNFFMDIANTLPREYGHSELLVTDKDALIASQSAEIQKLRLENELMKELISRKN
jgi:transcriptional regulator with XRE-family HTH domain